MPRRARIVLPGYVYHVTQRGNHRLNVFEEDKDRALYLKYVEEYSRKYMLKIYAYCLMDNHVHFLVMPQNKDSLARTFQITHQRYAFYSQRKTKQGGHLWQGRFFSCLVAGKHLQESVRYIEKNPVRAKMVRRAWDHPWSSARSHMEKKYKIITLADIKEIIDVPCWREYLMSEERERFLKMMRINTFRERIFGPKEFIKILENKFRIKLLLEKRGRPKLIK